MIHSCNGNILEASAQALVNPVNCVGVMGKGLARQFKLAYPEVYSDYRRAVKAGQVVLGKMHWVKLQSIWEPQYIINFPTKGHWRASSKLSDIEAGLVDLLQVIRELEITSIAIPPLGSGLGGLDWKEVRALILKAFDALPDCRLLLYEGFQSPMQRPSHSPLTSKRAIFLELMDRYRALDYPLTRLVAQKIAYFMQVFGEPLKLNFVADTYGPYDADLDKVLKALDGQYLHNSKTNRHDDEIELIESKLPEVKALLAKDAQAAALVEQLARFIQGYESPYGLELLSTVHWVVAEDPELAKDPQACLEAIHQWSEHKRALFKAYHVETALNQLTELG